MRHPKLTDHETAEDAIVTTCMIVAACAIALTVAGSVVAYKMCVGAEQKTADDIRNDVALERGDLAHERSARAMEAIAGALCNTDESRAKECQ